MHLTVSQAEESISPRHEAFLKGWALFQHELLYLCWGVMDVALLTPFALSLMSWARYWPPGLLFFWLLLIMGLSFNLARLMSALHLRPSYQQTIMAVGLTLLLFLSLRTLLHEPQSLFDVSWIGQFFQYLNERGNLLWQRHVLLFSVIVLMWARGTQMAGRTFTVSRIGLRLRVGGLFIAPLVIWVSSRNVFWNVTPFVLLFFLAALTAVALTRADEISREETGYSAALTPRWFVLIFTTGLLIIFMGGVAAMLISGETGTGVIGLLAPVWQALQATFITAVATLGYIAEPLFQLLEVAADVVLYLWQWVSLFFIYLAKIISKLYPTEWTPETTDVSEQGGTPADQPPLFENIPETIYEIGQNGQIIIVLLTFAVILVIALILQRTYRGAAVNARVSGRSAGSLKNIPEDEGGLMQKLLDRFGRWRNWRTAVSIRRIYRQMLALADAHGYPKLDAETPYEYLNTLIKVWPHNEADTKRITQAYVKVRYGELPETEEEVEQIRQAWQRLEQAPPTVNTVD